jgi:hypothetical protein
MPKTATAKSTEEIPKIKPKYSTFKNRPVISLPLVEGGNIWFTFGLSKAKLILEYLDEIKVFVREHDE